MKPPSITTSMDRPVNLLRATTTCNAFYIFFSAAKASLLPFLTLFFRLLGLTAMDTGIVMAAKTLTGFVWAPLWARCAVAYNKRRVVLMFSLLMMGAMYLSFVAVYYKVGPGGPLMCEPASVQDGNVSSVSHLNETTHLNGNGEAPSTHLNDHNDAQSPGTSVEQPGIPGHNSGSSSGGNGEESGSSVTSPDKTKGQESPAQVTNTSESDSGHHVLQTPEESSSGLEEEKGGSDSTVVPATVPHNTTSLGSVTEAEPSTTQSQTSVANADLIKALHKMPELPVSDLKQYVDEGKVSVSDLYTEAKKAMPEGKFTEEDLRKLLVETEGESVEDHSVEKRSLHRVTRTLHITLWNNLKDGFSALTTSLSENKMLRFLIVLLIIIFGEFFSSPVEKIADDAWFDFLERIDDMEKYGRQRYWGSLMFALVPIVVTCMVDYSPCSMVLGLHHFLLHFLVFGIFIALSLLIAFYFPMPPPVKHKYSSKVGKGLRVICCDGRGFLFVVTLLIAGAVYASFHNFLFWHLQDLGGQEVTMGLCVAVCAFAETPMLVFSNKLVRKLGHGGMASLSMFVLALRMLYYGFLWTPWAVLPVELTNAFTHTALWYAVLSYDEFNVGSAIDRSIRSILSSLYFGLGFSVGSFVSGVVYYTYSAPTLFWGASVLSAGWCLLYSLIQCCLPKKERVKYIKLLRKEEDESSDADDDWLEMALKDQ